MKDFNLNAAINGNHPAVKAAFAAVRSGNTLAEWIRNALAETGGQDVICAVGAYILLEKGKLDAFPYGKEGQTTDAYKAFAVYRQTFRRECEGYTLTTDSKTSTVSVGEATRKPRTPGADTKADKEAKQAVKGEKQASKGKSLEAASADVADLLNKAETDTKLEWLVRQLDRMGLTLDDLIDYAEKTAA